MIDKDALFKPRLTEREVEIPGLGSVRIRALSRQETLHLKDKAMPVDEVERRLVSLAMVEPSLTEAEVGQWQDTSSAGELEVITQAIAEMSGMNINGAKEAYKSVRG